MEDGGFRPIWLYACCMVLNSHFKDCLRLRIKVLPSHHWNISNPRRRNNHYVTKTGGRGCDATAIKPAVQEYMRKSQPLTPTLDVQPRTRIARYGCSVKLSRPVSRVTILSPKFQCYFQTPFCEMKRRPNVLLNKRW